MIYDPDSKDRRDPKLDAPRVLRESVIKPPERREAADDRRQEPRRTNDTPAPSMAELTALATTVRQCQRNGHPDLSKHLEALLTKLGA